MAYWYRTEVDNPETRPLLLYLHGVGEIGKVPGDSVRLIMRDGPWVTGEANGRVARTLRRYFRVAPHLRSERWDPDELKELIERIREQHADVDPTQLFLVGASLGGEAALELAASYGKALNITAMAVCCPSERTDLEAELVAAAAQTPTYLFHGERDARVDFTPKRERLYNKLENSARNFRWVKVRDDLVLSKKRHNCWRALLAHADLYRWFRTMADGPAARRKKKAWPAFKSLAAKKAVTL